MADYTFVWHNAASDLVGEGGLGNFQMLTTASGSGNISVDVPFDSTDSLAFFSLLDIPGSGIWRPLVSSQIKVNIITANSKITLNVAIQRVGFDGTFKAAYTITIPPGVSLGTTGLKTFNATTILQTEVLTTDRLRVGLSFTRDDSIGGDGIVEFQYGNVSSGVTIIPIEVPPIIDIHTSGLRDAVIVSRLVGSVVVDAIAIINSPSTFKVLPYTVRHVVDSNGNIGRPEGNSFFLHPTHGDRVTKAGTPYYQTSIYQKSGGVNRVTREKWLLDSSSAITGLNLSDIIKLPEKF